METLVYKISEFLEQEKFLDFSNESQRTELKKLQEETDDWMYTKEAVEADFIEFNRRHDTMDSIV